jgi:hypothetical protein
MLLAGGTSGWHPPHSATAHGLTRCTAVQPAPTAMKTTSVKPAQQCGQHHAIPASSWYVATPAGNYT